MGRIRKRTEPGTPPEKTVWRIGKYIRLSRDDGNDVSESVIHQDQILEDEIPRFFEAGAYEVVDTYIDDGTSGTTDLERRDFQRMVGDLERGRINCVMVKNLSRAFRNSANQGRFLEELIPLYNTRFISLYHPRIDTFLDPEVVHSLEVSITGFMNEQYAYKTSVDVRRTFRHKREKGEFIGAFAPYGYAKDPEDKNALVIDGEAAQVVRDIYAWFVSGGMSKAAIARRLNACGIPNPTAYKRGKGLLYANPHAAGSGGLWNPSTIARMLQDPVYAGVMRQGRQRVVSYKVHRRVSVPAREWVLVEDAVPAIVSQELFQTAQALHARDVRTPPEKQEVYLFSGFLRCADCKRSMTRRSAKGHVYYACRTDRDGPGARCTRHSIRQDVLEGAVLAAVQRQLALSPALPEIIEEVRRTPAISAGTHRLDALLAQRRAELEKTAELLDGLYLDWKKGDLTRDQYRRMKAKLEEESERLQRSAEQLQQERDAVLGEEAGDQYLAAFLRDGGIRTLSRGLLAALVDAVYVHQDGSIDLAFGFADPRRRAWDGVEHVPADSGGTE